MNSQIEKIEVEDEEDVYLSNGFAGTLCVNHEANPIEKKARGW